MGQEGRRVVRGRGSGRGSPVLLPQRHGAARVEHAAESAGDLRDEQDGGAGGDQVQVHVPQVATEISLQVSWQNLLWRMQGDGRQQSSVKYFCE